MHINRLGTAVPAVASAVDTMKYSVFTAFTPRSTGEGDWLLDIGCSTHVTGVKQYFSSYTGIPFGYRKIRVANNLEIDAMGEGAVTLRV